MPSPTPLRFAISRAHGKAHTLRGLQAFCELLGKQLKCRVESHVSFDYQRLLTDVLQEGIEISWMPPLLHARGAEKGFVVGAVCERATVLSYRSALLVRKESTYKVAKELKGVRYAWTDRHSAAGYFFPRQHLVKAGLDTKRDFGSEAFLGPVSATIEAVIDGTADVCACHVPEAGGADRQIAQSNIAEMSKAAARHLRIFDVTESIPPDALVIAPTVAADLQYAIVDALLTLDQTAEGTAVLHDLFNADRLVPLTDDIRTMIEATRSSLGTSFE